MPHRLILQSERFRNSSVKKKSFGSGQIVGDALTRTSLTLVSSLFAVQCIPSSLRQGAAWREVIALVMYWSAAGVLSVLFSAIVLL
jgi:hypothetical protein